MFHFFVHVLVINYCMSIFCPCPKLKSQSASWTLLFVIFLCFPLDIPCKVGLMEISDFCFWWYADTKQIPWGGCFVNEWTFLCCLCCNIIPPCTWDTVVAQHTSDVWLLLLKLSSVFPGLIVVGCLSYIYINDLYVFWLMPFNFS